MNPDTYFAPGPREEIEQVRTEAALLTSAHIGQHILDAVPDVALIVNDKRQIVAANARALKALGVGSVDEVLGKRPGEAMGCIHSVQGPQGCGTSIACRQCGAVNAVISALNTKGTIERECRITAGTPAGEAPMELFVRASYVKVGAYSLVLVVLKDLSSEKRKQVLERLFFHDVLNTVNGMVGLTDVLTAVQAEDVSEYARELRSMAESVAEEITAHRDLVQAESGKLAVHVSEVSVGEVFERVVESLTYHHACENRTIQTSAPPECCLNTDPVLLRRVVSNMAKNAVEASPPGAVIRLTAALTESGVVIRVNNPGVIPEPVQNQLFKRSFSTKGEPGRGLGTYSIKLFSERFLQGHVSFETNSQHGTTFSVSLPSLVEAAQQRSA